MSEENKRKLWLYYLLLGSAVGAVAETTAFLLNWWVFDPWWFFIPWLFIWEGACFGSLAFLTRKLHPLAQYGIGAAIGCAGEMISAYVYPVWVFPGEKLLFLEGLPAIIIGLTIIFGLICPSMTFVINKITKTD